MIRTVTFLLTDIEQSTQLWEHDSDQMGAALESHDSIIAESVERNNGRLIKSKGEGDSHFIVFEHASDAAAAAFDIQKALQRQDWPTETPLRVRMSIHLGEIEERNGDFYGQEVNRAARLRSIGHGGQVLISAAVRELIQARLQPGCSLVDLGDHRLKDLLRAEHVYQLAFDGMQSSFPPLNSLDKAKTNMPVQLTSFIGREDDIDQLRKRLAKDRLVTLMGPGGCGKTRLAIQAAVETSEEFPDGVWFVDFATVDSSSATERAVAASLSIPLNPGIGLQDNILSFLSKKKMLIVLDNCEHLGDGPAGFAAAALKALPDLRLLATSRRPLGLGSEQIFTVRPLTRPAAGAATRKRVLSSESALLMIDRAWAKAPSFQVTDANATSVAALCAALEGIPLAIELAASRLRVLSPDQLLVRLSKSLDLLKSGSSDVDARHRTLRATVEWSFNLLKQEEKDLLARMSFLPAGCSLEIAEIAAGDLFDDRFELIDILESLVNNSLIQVEGTEVPRYRMLETIRQYCAEMVQSDLAAKVFERLVPWAISFACATKPKLLGSTQRETLTQIEAEYENLRACLSWAQEHPDPGNSMLALASELDRFWFRVGMVAEGGQWLELALSSPGGEPTKRALALRSAGTFAWQRRDMSDAIRLLNESIDVLRQIGDELPLIGAISNLGSLLAEFGKLDESSRCFLEALELARASGDVHLAGLVLQNLGKLEWDRGDMDKAMEYFSEALPMVVGREEGKYTHAVLLANIACIKSKRGNTKEAANLLKQSIEIARELNNGQLLGESLLYLARAAYADKMFEMSVRLIGCSRQAWKAAALTPGPQNADDELDLVMNLREVVGPDVVAEALSMGSGMTLAEIADYAIAGGDLLVDIMPREK